MALAGTFGYELDITKLSAEDQAMIPRQVEMYHQYNDLVRSGEYYRIASYQENRMFDCWEVISDDGKEVLVTFVQVMGRPNFHSRRILLQGLREDAIYRNARDGRTYSGGALMYAGLNVENLWGDFRSMLIHLKMVEIEDGFLG